VEKNNSIQEKLSVEFVLTVLRQHEIEFDRLLAELEMLVHKVNELSIKLECKVA
jgi:hypothetical protein